MSDELSKNVCHEPLSFAAKYMRRFVFAFSFSFSAATR